MREEVCDGCPGVVAASRDRGAERERGDTRDGGAERDGGDARDKSDERARPLAELLGEISTDAGSLLKLRSLLTSAAPRVHDALASWRAWSHSERSAPDEASRYTTLLALAASDGGEIAKVAPSRAETRASASCMWPFGTLGLALSSSYL